MESFIEVLTELKCSLETEKLSLEKQIEDEKGSAEEAAAEVTKIKEEVRELNKTLVAVRDEFTITVQRRRDIEVDLAKVLAERQSLERDILTIRDQMLNTQANIQVITSQVMKEEGMISRTSSEASNLEKQSRKTSSDVEEMEKDISRLKKLLLDFTNDKLKLAGTYDEYQRRLNSLQQAKSKEQEFLSINSRKLTELESEKVTLAKERDSLYAELTSARDDLSGKISELSSFKSSNSELLLKNEEMSSSLNTLESTLQTKLEAQKTSHEHETLLLKGQVDKKQAELDVAEKSIVHANDALSAMKGEVESLRAEHTMLLESLKAAKNRAEEAEKARNEMKAEILHVKEEGDIARSKLMVEIESLQEKIFNMRIYM